MKRIYGKGSSSNLAILHLCLLHNSEKPQVLPKCSTPSITENKARKIYMIQLCMHIVEYAPRTVHV